MRKAFKLLAVSLTAATLLVVSFIVFAQEFVAISPRTLNLDQFAGSEITVHAAIDYDEDADVTLASEYGTIDAVATFADDRGDLVAKFSIEDVEGIVAEGEVILTLYVDAEEIGSDTIRVISGGNKKGK